MCRFNQRIPRNRTPEIVRFMNKYSHCFNAVINNVTGIYTCGTKKIIIHIHMQFNKGVRREKLCRKLAKRIRTEA